jgi:hypothetical protein
MDRHQHQGLTCSLRVLATTGPGRVGAILPAVFDSYARVLHRAFRSTGCPGTREPVRWRDIAHANRRIIHPLAQWDFLLPATTDASGQPGLWNTRPSTGDPDPHTVHGLASVPRTRTQRPRMCWFAVREGNTALDAIATLAADRRSAAATTSSSATPSTRRALNCTASPRRCGGPTTAHGACQAIPN